MALSLKVFLEFQAIMEREFLFSWVCSVNNLRSAVLETACLKSCIFINLFCMRVYACCIYYCSCLVYVCVCVLYFALLYFTFNLYRAPLKISIQLLSGSPVKSYN